MSQSLTLKLRIDADGKVARTEILSVGDATQRTTRELGNMDDTASRLGKRLVGLVGGVSIGAWAVKSASDFAQFDAKLREVNTLLGDTPGELDRLSEAAREQAKAFGTTALEQVAAEYQLVSGGAETAAQTTERLTAANKLAVGGVTDVQTAAGGLVAVLNTYGDKAGTVSDISDTMFVAMKNGVTTIGQLSSEIGKAAPLAEKSGVSFDELAATIAALTKGGISTAESVTGVKAILTSIIKPTKEAADMAADLKLEFNAQSLAAKGLAGFMADVSEKTKGSSEAIGTLFGGTEAMVPALSLTGKAGEYLASTLAQMEEKAGATDKAFKDVMDGSLKQGEALFSKLGDESLSFGESLDAVLNPALHYANDNFKDLTNTAKILAESLTALLIARTVGSTYTRMSAEIATSTAAAAANRTATLASAASANTEAQARRRQLDAIRIHAEMRLAEARATVAATSGMARLNAQINVLTPAEKALARATAAASQAQITAAGTANRLAAAQHSMSISARAGAASMRVLRGTLTFLGGPLGVAMLAASAIAIFTMNSGEAKRSASELSMEVDNLSASYQTMGKELLAVERNKLTANLVAQKDAVSALKQEVADLQVYSKLGFQGAFGMESSAEAAEKARIKTDELNLAMKRQTDTEKLLVKMTGELEKETTKATKATGAAADAAKDFEAANQKEVTTLLKTTKGLLKAEEAQADYNSKVDAAKRLLELGKYTQTQYNTAIKEAKIQMDNASGATKQLKIETKDLADTQDDAKQKAEALERATQSVIDRLNPAEAATRKYKEELQNLQTEAAKGNAMASQSIVLLAEDYQTTQQKIAEAAAEMALASNPVAKAWNDMGTGVQQGLSGMLDGSIKSFGDFADSMEGQLKSMLANMASQWISSSFTKMVGGQGQAGNPMSSLTSMFAGGSPAPGSQAAMLAEQTAGMDGGSFGSAGNAAMAAAGPIGIALAINSMLTPVIEKKLGRDAGNGMKYGGLSGAFAGKVFGFGSRKQTDAGVTLDYSGGEISGQDYKRWKKKKFLKTKRWTDYSDMDSGLENSLNDTMDELEQGITRFAENMGKSATAQLNSFTTSTKLSLKGMDEEEAQAAIEGWVQETGGQMLKAVMPNLTGMIDGAGERVGEMVNSLLTVSDFIAMDFAPAAQVSLWDAAKQQLGSLNEIVTQFDGSVDAANEMAEQSQLAASAIVQMVSYIEGAETQISGMLGQTYNSIWEDTQSSSELYNHYLSEANFLGSQVLLATDPEAIQQNSVAFNDAITSSYRHLTAAYDEGKQRQLDLLDQELKDQLAQQDITAKQAQAYRDDMDVRRKAVNDDFDKQERQAREGFLTQIKGYETTTIGLLEGYRTEIITDQQTTADTIAEKLGSVAAEQQAAAEKLANAGDNLTTAAVNLNNAAVFMSQAYINDSANWG